MAIHFATAQVNIGTTATLLLAARATRTRVRIHKGTATLFLGNSNGVTISNGYQITTEEYEFFPTDDIYAICQGSARVIQVLEEYS